MNTATTYGYDFSNQLTTVTNASTTTYGYDPTGNRTDPGSVLNVGFTGAGGKDAITLDYTPGVEFGTVVLTKDQKH